VRNPVGWSAAAALLAGVGLGSSAAAEGELGVRTDVSVGGAVLHSFARPNGEFVDNVGVGVGLLVDGRIGHGLFGVSADATATIYNQRELFAGVNFGFVSDSDAEVTVLAEVGAHVLRDVGRDAFVEVDTPVVLLPAAGLRVGLDRRRGPGHLDFGFWVFARADIGRQSVNVVGTSCAFGCPNAEGLYRVGGLSGGAAFRIVFGGDGRARP
jgi:hypothetical protein